MFEVKVEVKVEAEVEIKEQRLSGELYLLSYRFYVRGRCGQEVRSLKPMSSNCNSELLNLKSYGYYKKTAPAPKAETAINHT